MCQPDSQPCINTTNDKTKIYQLKAATKKMLTKLQAVSATPGDVQVGIVPFNRAIDVGTDECQQRPGLTGRLGSAAGECRHDQHQCRPGQRLSLSGLTAAPMVSVAGTSEPDIVSNANTVPGSGLICPGAGQWR